VIFFEKNINHLSDVMTLCEDIFKTVNKSGSSVLKRP